MADNALLKEYRKARRNNTLEADPAAMLVEVIEEVIKLRKELDEVQVRITALEGAKVIPVKAIIEPVKAIEEI